MKKSTQPIVSIEASVVHMNYWLREKFRRVNEIPSDVYVNFFKKYTNACIYYKSVGLDTCDTWNVKFHVYCAAGYVEKIVVDCKGISTYKIDRMKALQEEFDKLNYENLRKQSFALNEGSTLHDPQLVMRTKLDPLTDFEQTLEGLVNQIKSL